MNTKEEIIVAYLDKVKNDNDIWNTEDEFPSYVNGIPVNLFSFIICFIIVISHSSR